MPHVWQCSNCVLNFSRRLYRQDQVDRVAHADIVKAENRNRWFYASSNLDTANAQRVKPETALLIKSQRRSVDVRPADEQLLCAMRTQVGDGRAEQRAADAGTGMPSRSPAISAGRSSTRCSAPRTISGPRPTRRGERPRTTRDPARFLSVRSIAGSCPRRPGQRALPKHARVERAKAAAKEVTLGVARRPSGSAQQARAGIMGPRDAIGNHRLVPSAPAMNRQRRAGKEGRALSPHIHCRGCHDCRSVASFERDATLRR